MCKENKNIIGYLNILDANSVNNFDGGGGGAGRFRDLPRIYLAQGHTIFVIANQFAPTAGVAANKTSQR